ncbi:MAG: hypothetical protein H6907_08585 [Hyphomicrobiales bacterium]|nr:hypothetical protein [Hyphomicrobiales bacterium]MCP5371774.1 hypothetical protein [Hyphomicrobiales bacterium]
MALRSCEECPGTNDCAAENLYPILGRVLALYAGGTTDKFEILFALPEGDEELLEKFDYRVSKTCWTKAALLTLADELAARLPAAPADQAEAVASAVLSTGRDAFARFPWNLPDLVDQAAALYVAVLDRCDDPDAVAAALSRRAFLKVCKAVTYG